MTSFLLTVKIILTLGLVSFAAAILLGDSTAKDKVERRVEIVIVSIFFFLSIWGAVALWV